MDIGLNIKNVFSKDIAETAIALNVKQRDGSGIGLIGLVDKTPLLAGEKKRLTFRKAYKNEQRAKIFEAQVLTLCVSVAIDASGEHYEFNGTEGF